jgi:leucyl aminopeptidase
VLVGKGITFDSGGLSLKTPEGMTTMKTDMTGAAIVLAAISAASRLGAGCKITAIAPITENLPGQRAMKPGDVLTARNGATIEVLNTDAEGRLVLADGLSLAAELQPDAIIDVATLTGAVRIALGPDVAAVMGSDPELVASLRESGDRQGEPLWELPLVDSYDSHLDSEIADMKNIGKPGQAGTIVAGLFLRRFTSGLPWAHLDIAATGRAESDDGYVVKGATAFSLRTLVDFLVTR